MPQLDSLRAIAVFVVIYTHYLPPPYWPFGVYWGDLGVRCFFVLSGFLITSILLRDFDQSPNFATAWRAFLFRRFLRLMPLLATTLAIAYALDIKPVRETIFWHITYLTNFYLARVEDWQVPVGHLWTLAVEEQFYLVWPFFIYLVPRRHIVKATLLLVVLSPLFRWYWRELGRGDIGAWVLPLGSVDALGTGALLAFCPADTALRRRTLAVIGVVGAGCWLLFHLSEGRSSAWSTYSFDLSILGLALFFAWVVGKVALGLRGPVGRCLDNTILQYLGRISYGLYLLHPFVQALLSRWKNLPSYFLAPFSTATTVLFAAASWHFLEKPLRARGRRIRRLPVA